MQASATRLDPLSKMTPLVVEAARQPWYPRAWNAFDNVGEVKGGGRFMESAAARVAIALGITPSVGEDPVPIHDAIERGLVIGAPGSPEEESAQEEPVVSLEALDLAEQLTEGIVNGEESEGALLGGWALKSFVVGEAYVVGYVDPVTLEEVWLVLSSDELQKDEKAKSGQSQVIVRRSPAATASAGTPNSGVVETVLPPEATIIRVWRKHGRWGDLSDSNLSGCLTECDELRVLDASIKATGLSRIPAGILAISEDVEPKPVALEPDEDDETENPTQDPLLVELVKHLSTPIQDPGSASAVTPFVMRLPTSVDGTVAKDLAFMIDLGRQLDPEVVNRCQYLRERIAATLELPSERITGGIGESNHWSAWLIDEETYRLYVAPTVQPLLDALTKKYLRPRLILSGIPKEEADRFVFYGDASDLTTRPNRVDNAKAGFEGMAISLEAYRDALGFKDDDAPTPEEVLLRIITRQTVLPAEVIPLLNEILGTEVRSPAINTTSTEVPSPPSSEAPGGSSAGSEGSGSGDIPATEDNVEPTVASAASRRVAERLAQIDRSLRERILAAADAAVSRSVERAGAKLRSSLTSSRIGTARYEVKQEVAHVSNRHLLSTLGRARIAALGVEPDDLFGDDLDDLEEKWDEWTAGARNDVISIASRSLGVNPDGEAIRAYQAQGEDRSALGWAMLSAALVSIAKASVFDPKPSAVPGEVGSTTVSPSIVRQSLAIAGGSSPVRTPQGGVKDGATGGPAGGIATGDDVANLWGSFGQPFTGYEWVYNFEGQKTFDPHLDLNGSTFSDWQDEKLSTFGSGEEWVGDFFYPGDHGGCRCDAMPVIGT